MKPLALFALLVLLSPGILSADPLDVVALPIVVHTSESDSRYVSEGLADMLSSRLEQLRGVRVLSLGDAEPATANLEEALALGREAGGDYVIFGAFTQFGDGASLDVQCAPLREQSLERTLASRRIFVQSGAIGEIIPKLDELVDRVAFYLDRKPIEGGEGEVAATQRPSPSVGAGPGASEEGLQTLRDRVDALERAVYGSPADAAAAGGVPVESVGTPRS